MPRLRRLSTYAAITLAAITMLMILLGRGAQTGIPLVLFFFTLALSLSTKSTTQPYVFTIFVFMAVAAAMYYPSIFLSIGGFDLKRLIIPILMVIMFGMGTNMSVQDFIGVIKMPRGVFIGLVCQFSIMPLLGFALANISGFSAEIAAGIILVGCSPSGLASNVMSYIAKANLALSLTLTMVATLLSPLITPFLMERLAGQLVPIDFLAMMWSITKIVFIPVVAGLLFNHLAHGRFRWLDKAMPMVSMSGIAIVIAIITAAGRDALLSIGLALIGVVLVHNLLGYTLGFWASRLLGLDKQSAQTIAFEVGMQNSGLASGIALEMGRLATMGLAPVLFSPFMNITGSSLAAYWREQQIE
ncbi:MAG: bile acid:sodium symporter family protein [Chitinophagales bacterium]|nr:bile acid:sodium symporter family protein [Chitinophagales bacterium]